MTAPTIRDVRTQGRELQLQAVDEAAGTARRFVVETLQKWGMPDTTVEAAELVASELTTNAVRHTERTAVDVGREWRPPDLPAVVWVRVRLSHGQSVVVEVWDADPTPPVMKAQSLTAEDGRGLYLVAMVSNRWGYYWPSAGGKVVWAEVAVVKEKCVTRRESNTLPTLMANAYGPDCLTSD